MRSTSNIFLPISVNISGKQIGIVGGGKVAFRKASILSLFTKKVVVIAPRFLPEFNLLNFELRYKAYELKDLESFFLVYICTEQKHLNTQIKIECEKAHIFACLCDEPDQCDFISPAIYKKNQLTIAVSSNAQNVLQSIFVRNQIVELILKNVLKTSVC